MVKASLLSFFPSLRETKFVNAKKNNYMCEQNPDMEKGENEIKQKYMYPSVLSDISPNQGRMN